MRSALRIDAAATCISQTSTRRGAAQPLRRRPRPRDERDAWRRLRRRRQDLLHRARSRSATGTGCWDGAYEPTHPSSTCASAAPRRRALRARAGRHRPERPPPCRLRRRLRRRLAGLLHERSRADPDDEGIHDPELYEYDTETATPDPRLARRIGLDAEATSTVSRRSPPTAAPSTSRRSAGSRPTRRRRAAKRSTSTATTPKTPPPPTSRPSTSAITPTASTDRWWSFPHGEEIGLDPAANWETTPDGRYLLFATTHAQHLQQHCRR